MAMLPPTRSSGWLFLFLVVAALLTGGILWVGSANSGHAPGQATVMSVVGVCAGISALLTLLGFVGARAAFVCAVLGLGIGLIGMIYTATSGSEGMADLAALLGFLMYGSIGLGLGLLIDLGRWIGGRRRD